MAVTRTCYLLTLILMFLSCPLLSAPAQAQENRNVARVAVWQAKQGMAHELEEGYKRHLSWHRKMEIPGRGTDGRSFRGSDRILC
jgi:hypothetical protein